MARFRIHGTDATGRRIEETVDAADPAAAARQARERGWVVTSLEPLDAPSRPGRATAEEFALFNTELAALVGAGVPLERAVASLAKDMRRGALRRAVEAVAADLEAGVPLSQAVDRHRGTFPELYGAMLDAGAASGDLRGTLVLVAEHATRMAAVRRKLVDAAVYPAAMIVLIVAAITAWAHMILPTWLQFYDELETVGIGVPPAIRAVHWLAANLAWILAGVAVLLLGLAGAAAAWRRTARGRRALDAWALSIPILRGILLAAFRVRFCRTLSALLSRSVPLPCALSLVEAIAGNAELRARVADLRSRVEAGQKLSDAMDDRRAFPHLLSWTVSLSEERGRLAESLADLGQVFEADLDRRTRLWLAISSPALIIAAASFLLLAGFFALFPLLWTLTSILQGIS